MIGERSKNSPCKFCLKLASLYTYIYVYKSYGTSEGKQVFTIVQRFNEHYSIALDKFNDISLIYEGYQILCKYVGRLIIALLTKRLTFGDFLAYHVSSWFLILPLSFQPTHGLSKDIMKHDKRAYHLLCY